MTHTANDQAIATDALEISSQAPPLREAQADAATTQESPAKKYQFRNQAVLNIPTLMVSNAIHGLEPLKSDLRLAWELQPTHLTLGVCLYLCLGMCIMFGLMPSLMHVAFWVMNYFTHQHVPTP